MGSGVEATAHLAEVEFRSQGQYRTRIRRTNRSLSAILAAHDFDMPHNCIAASVAKILGETPGLANAMRFTKGHFLSEKMSSVKYLYPTENMIP